MSDKDMKPLTLDNAGEFAEMLDMNDRAERYASMRLAKLALKLAAEHLSTASHYLNEVELVPTKSFERLLHCRDEINDIVKSDLSDEKIGRHRPVTIRFGLA